MQWSDNSTQTTASSGKVLVTGFEPFGLIRGHVPLLKGNRSQRLLQMLRERFGSQDCEYLVLPVDHTAVATLERHLTPMTAGAFMMGEDMLAGLRIETTSYDPQAQRGVGPFQFRTPGGRRGLTLRRGTFRGDERPTRGLHRLREWDVLLQSCVLEGQEWGQSSGRPTVFIHVGPFQSVDIQFQRVSRMLKELLVSARQGQNTPRASGAVFV